MPSKDIETTLKRLRSHGHASRIITAIERSPKFPPDKRFDDLYELIVTNKAGFATTMLLANVPGHTRHDVYVHPDIITRWTSLRGYYTSAGITSVLCVVCLDNPLLPNGWQLSTQAVQNATGKPGSEFEAFIGYAIAPPGAMVMKPINPGQRRWHY